ncbi:MAG: tyrosine-type recombinase/integrase [Anaerolineae bacterium]|nr:tyrosine-type recombinase/integrase [Anaerolineae bacterium]
MKLSEAIAYFDQSRAGEVALSTRRWFYYVNDQGQPCGRLWSLVESLGDGEVCAVTVRDLRQWRADLLARDCRWADSNVRPTQKGGLSQDGFRNYIRAARQFFKWLADEGIVGENPALRLPIPPPSTEEPKAIDVADALKILHTARIFALRDYAYILLAKETGAKVGELDRLECADIDPANGRVTIHRYTRYTYTPRLRTVSPDVCAALLAWCHVRGETALPKDGLVFSGRSGQFPVPLKGGIAFGVRNEAIIQTLASSACRVGGIASMQVDRVNLDNGTAVVWEKGQGGYLKSRLVYLDEGAVTAVSRWLSVHPGGDALFPGVRGALTRDGVYQVLTALAAEAGVTQFTNPHAWRHAWSIEALRRGADVTTVARVLGNSPQTVIQNYARWANGDIQQRHAQFNWKSNAAD